MFGISLIHAAFLASAAAVAVPILIHLLMRPRARHVSIGTLRFLKLAMTETTRQRKVRRWLLLALRTAAILLLTFLFARPYLSATDEPGQDREVIVLIDQSGSMAAMTGGQSFFSLAQTVAGNIIKDLPNGTKAHLAYFDSRGVVSSPNARVDAQRVPGFAGTDFGQALCWARDVFVTSNRRHKKVYLLTDLQRTGRHVPCKNFPVDAEVEVVEIGKPLARNIAVEKAEVPQTTIRPREPLVISARVSNAGILPAHNVQVKLRFEGGGGDQSKTIALAPAATQQVDFSVPINQPGLYQAYVEVTVNDGFTMDNRRWLAFDARDADRILLVDGEPGRSIFSSETYYLETALRLTLPGKSSTLSPFAPERLDLESARHLPDLAPYSVVVLCNAAQLDNADLTRLKAFVEWGGRLLIFTGMKVQPMAYAALNQAGLLPCTIEDGTDAGLFRFQKWDKGHPIFRPLSDPQQGDLRRVAFRKISHVKPAADAKVLASAPGGKPLLLEKTLGRGIVLLFATAADRDWGDWPQSRLYVPLVHQILGYLTDRLPENQRVRSEIAGPNLDKPPGIVRDNLAVIVRNVDARESRIERYSPKQFREEYHLAEVKKAGPSPQVIAAALSLGAERPGEFWPTVACVLLLVLGLELFVANRTHA